MSLLNKTLIRAVSVLIIALEAAFQAGAAETGVLVNVWPLAFGVARPGAVMPVVVELMNQSPVFEGEIEAWIGESEGAWVVAQKVSVGRGKFRFFMYPPFPAHETGDLYVRVVNRATRVVASQTVSVIPKPGHLWVGIYAGKGRSFGPQNVPDKKAAIINLYKTDLMPDQWYGYKFLDVLFWDGHEAVMLTKEQQKALEQWVAQGGRLILTARTGDMTIVPPFSGTMLPATVALESTSTPGEQVLFSAKEFPATPPSLYSERTFGLGTIVLLRCDVDSVATLLPDELAKLLTGFSPGHRDVSRRNRNSPAGSRAYDAEEWGGVGQLLARYSGFVKLEFNPVLYTMLFYIFMISIVEYLVLRKWRKLGWTWIVFPLQIAVFSLYAFCVFYQGELGKNERYELVFHDIGPDLLSRMVAFSCIRKNATKPYVATLERAHLIVPFKDGPGGEDMNYMRYDRRGNATSGTVMRETTASSTDKQVAIPGYVRSLKFFTEAWSGTETNLPFICQFAFKNGNLGGLITKNRTLSVFEWFLLFKGKIYEVNTAGAISGGTRKPAKTNYNHFHHAAISQEETDIRLKMDVINRVRSRVDRFVEWSRDSPNHDEYLRYKADNDDMLPPFVRENEAILFAFCEEQKEYDSVSVKTIRCYRQIVDVGATP